MLTKKECEELVGLLFIRDVLDQISVYDIWRTVRLENKATEDQLIWTKGQAYSNTGEPEFAPEPKEVPKR